MVAAKPIEGNYWSLYLGRFIIIDTPIMASTKVTKPKAF
jgi:hypothetical protein